MISFKKVQSPIKIIFGVILLFCALFALTGIYITLYSYGSGDKRSDCAVVFGSALNTDATPSQALRDRVKTGYELYSSGFVKCIIVTGADSEYGKHEADVMKEMLMELSVPKEDIVTDYGGKNTCSSLRNLSKDKNYVFVSNDFHLARINLLAKKMGLKNYSLLPSKYYEGVYVKTPYFFSREIIAFWYYMLFFDNKCERDFRRVNIKVDGYITKIFKYFYGEY